MVSQLDLSSNELCGLDRGGRGTYTAEGITAIADALRVNVGLTKISLAGNKLGEEGTKAICEALKQNKILKELDLSGYVGYVGSNIGGAAGAKHVADMLGVNSALTVANLLGNQLDVESTKMLAEVAKQKGISLCGIQRDQATADFSNQGLQPPDAILLASDLSQAIVTGALTIVDLSRNVETLTHYGRDMTGIKELAAALGVNGGLTALNFSTNSLKDEGVHAVCEAIQSNKETKLASLNFSFNSIGPVGANAVAAMVAVTGGLTSLNLSSNDIGGYWDGQEKTLVLTPEGPKAIADAFLVNGALTALDLSYNSLKDEGVHAVCEAIQSNKETKLASLNFKNNGIGPGGANAVAAMVAVTGTLTALDLSSNRLKDEGVSAVCEAIQSNKETKLASLNFKDNGIGPVGSKSVAAMVAVTGALTEVLIF
jgi:Ran GTPase-activating protein (RanGAP) involved in mRNA processing and transport